MFVKQESTTASLHGMCDMVFLFSFCTVIFFYTMVFEGLHGAFVWVGLFYGFWNFTFIVLMSGYSCDFCCILLAVVEEGEAFIGR